MRQGTFIAIVFFMLSFPAAPGLAAEPNGLCGVVWPMTGDSVFELRAGLQYRYLEVYVAPRYDKTLAATGDVSTDARVYGIYNAVDANMAAKLLGATMALPAGNLYAGLYGGYEYSGGDVEGGWLVGGRMVTYEETTFRVESCVEYQRSWSSFDDDDDQYTLLSGLRISF